MRLKFLLAFFLIIIAVTTPAQKAAKPPITPKQDVVLDVMKAELARATAELGKADPAPYFTGYSVEDEDNTVVFAANGALISSGSNRRRAADVFVRVGSPTFDNTHGEAR